MKKRITKLDLAQAVHALNHARLTPGAIDVIGYIKDGKIYKVINITCSGEVNTINLFTNPRDVYDYLNRLTQFAKEIYGVA